MKRNSRRQKKKNKDDETIALHDLQLLKTTSPGYIETEGETRRVTQEEICRNVSIQSSKKRFDLHLDAGGTYSVDYTQNGRHLLIGGSRGHVGAFDWQTGKLWCELNMEDPVYDVSWLHNETFFATAQQKHVYIYDKAGAEIHRLKKHVFPRILEFLPFHFLLASVGEEGMLRYQDVSTGELVAEWATKTGKCLAMRANPQTAVLHIGHAGGTVTLWSPSINGHLVKMLCHKGPVQALAVDLTGRHMATAGLDGIVKVWDLRTYRELHRHFTPQTVTTLDISQRGLLAAGHGPRVTIWNLAHGQRSPYLSHLVAGEDTNSLRFCPFDDVLGIGHSGGFSSILVPGAGEPNYDALEANPYATRKQRQESEVKKLLDKLQPETIVLDPHLFKAIKYN